MTEPFELVFRSDDVIDETAREVVVAEVVVERVMLLKILAPVQVLLSARRVEDDTPDMAPQVT